MSMFVNVIPDILKLEKSYWYKVPNGLAQLDQIKVGSVVRINIHSQRTKGWISAIAISLPQVQSNQEELDPDKLKDIIQYVSDGPPEHVVRFCEKLSEHYLVSPVYFLRSATPKKITKGIIYKKRAISKTNKPKLILVNPRANRRESIDKNISKTGSTLIVSPESHQKLCDWLTSKGEKTINYVEADQLTPELFSRATKPKQVIIGGRKSLFSPSSDIESIIILDDSYEQLRDERTPKWHAVDVAQIYSQMFGTQLTVISSNPSFMSAVSEIEDCRSTSNQWPEIYIDDKLESDPALGTFSREIVDSIVTALEDGKNAAVILNNKTAARLLSCISCSEIATCESCNHNVVQIETKLHEFQCLNCETIRPAICLHCQGSKFKKLRRGVPSLFEECVKLFSRWNVQVFEKNIDNASGPTLFISTEAILYDEKIAKTLASIIFIDFDSTLFRNSQESFSQSLVLVNRALRKLQATDNKNPLIISTRVKTNPIIEDIVKGDFIANTLRDIELRKTLELPPYFATLNITSNTQSIEKLAESLGDKVVVGIKNDGETSSLLLKAKSHEELYHVANQKIRSFISRNRCSISVDFNS